MGLLFLVILFLGVLFLLGSLDDFMIDLVHLFGRISPEKISPSTWKIWRGLEEKSIAIMIPAWKEQSVLEAMVRTNLTRLKYSKYKWYVGVYPNDPETLAVARRLEAQFPEKVTVVVTDRPGPTSKAHCLNCIMEVLAAEVRSAEQSGNGFKPHYVAIHDAEDVLHPESLVAVNAQPSDLDFIQVPIFSLPVSVKDWVAGTYLDEFAEIHLKEVPARQLLNMPIPSAGVGTFFSYRILDLLTRRFGYCFNEGNLTEDYEISQRIARVGGKQRFLLIRDEKGHIVATREYFPDSFGRSVRQKTRWTTGIALQTASQWQYFGFLEDRGGKVFLRNLLAVYGLYRDRKALWANPAAFFAWIFLVGSLIQLYGMGRVAGFSEAESEILTVLMTANAFLFSIRILQRMRFTTQVYGWTHGMAAFPRVIHSNLINALSSFSAIKGYFIARAGKVSDQIKWDKTEHKYPGQEQISAIE